MHTLENLDFDFNDLTGDFILAVISRDLFNSGDYLKEVLQT